LDADARGTGIPYSSQEKRRSSVNFDVAGPFEITRHGKKRMIIEQSMPDLRPQLESWKPGLSGACGCYVFALKAGRGYTPYYVGQACKTSILREALNPSNREKYNKVCSEGKGSPVIFFLPKLTPKGRYRKKGRRSAAIDFLERWLIAAAIEKNPGLINNKLTRFLRNIHVVGVFNAGKGKRPTASQELRRTLW
jgi:hypothetical protein